MKVKDFDIVWNKKYGFGFVIQTIKLGMVQVAFKGKIKNIWVSNLRTK
jgi:hypothetical protein